MIHCTRLGLAILSATAAIVVIAPGAASATTLEVGGAAKNSSITIETSLAPETSAILQDEFGTTTDTCTSSFMEGVTESPFTATRVQGIVLLANNTSCTHTTHTLKTGRATVEWIKGSTDGTVTSSEGEVTVQSTFFGASAICKTGAGTDIGRITGKSSGQATMDVTAKINCGILGTAQLSATYVVTTPEGLGVVE